MPNYDQFKKAWNSMWNAERKKYTEQYKNDAQFQQFANQYSQEMKNTGTQWTVNQNLNTNTNQWTNTQQWVVNNQNQTNANETNWQNQTNFSETKKPDVDKSVVAENFDQSRLTNDNAQVSVKEWTAAQTWMPDYEADSDARDNEIVNNLNAYINSNPEFFSDRATFNQNFHYSERNQRQKALLDSFWKGQEDRKKASTYATWDSIVQGMNSWEITTDQMNYIKSMNPEAYREWQQKQEELVNKRIANYTVPADPVNTAELFNQLVEKLGLQQWDPYKIYENWYGMCEQLGVFALNSRLESKIAEIEQNANERTRALERITKEWAWRKSQQLINAEMAKTSAIYDSRNADLQTAYNALYNQRQQNLAIANQSATALQMQWNEDSRVFNNKIAALWFAVTTASFRTPEQNLQNQLNFQAASNELNLLNQSKINDLNLYNTYATNKLKNQMEAEDTDLNTTDENQLRNNLNTVLSQYYSSYWDIIKRSQAQVVDDVIAYAKKNNCSIGEALTKNFIEPLQNKPEYRNKINQNYWMYGSQSLWTIGWNDVIITKNPDWTMNFRYLWNTQANNLSQGLANFVLQHPVDTKWGQCWSFVNDYLQDLWLGRLFWNEYSQKKSLKNTDVATVWSIAIMPSSKSPKNWHVSVVTYINNEKWTVTVVESNWWWDEKVHTREVPMSSIYWYYAPSIDWGWTYSTGYSTSRIWAYDKYLENWTLPSDKKLAEMWWLEKFEAEVKAYREAKWLEEYSASAKKEITNLRKEFNSLPEVKEARDMLNNYNKILSSSNWTAAWDMAMIFAFMKMLDPGSVVRETEFANAQNAAWVPDRIRNYFNQAKSWTRLSKQQRDDFLEVWQNFLQKYAEKYNQTLEQYQSYAMEWWDVSQIWEYMQLPWNYKTSSLQELVNWWGNRSDTIDSLINRWKRQ